MCAGCVPALPTAGSGTPRQAGHLRLHSARGQGALPCEQGRAARQTSTTRPAARAAVGCARILRGMSADTGQELRRSRFVRAPVMACRSASRARPAARLIIVHSSGRLDQHRSRSKPASTPSGALVARSVIKASGLPVHVVGLAAIGVCVYSPCQEVALPLAKVDHNTPGRVEFKMLRQAWMEAHRPRLVEAHLNNHACESHFQSDFERRDELHARPCGQACDPFVCHIQAAPTADGGFGSGC